MSGTDYNPKTRLSSAKAVQTAMRAQAIASGFDLPAEAENLSLRELELAEAFLAKNGKASEAAKETGYNVSAARRALLRPRVGAYLRARRAQFVQSRMVTTEFVVGELLDLLRKSKEPEAVLDGFGNPTGFFTLDGKTASNCLRMLGEHLGMFTKEQAKAPEPMQFNIIMGQDPRREAIRAQLMQEHNQQRKRASEMIDITPTEAGGKPLNNPRPDLPEIIMED